MSTSKNFKVYFDFGTDIHITDFSVISFPVNDSRARKSSPKKVLDAERDFILSIPYTGDIYYYVVVQVLAYTIGTGNKEWVSSDANVEYLAIFSWDDMDVYIGPQSTVAGVYAFARGIIAGGGQIINIAGSANFRKVAYGMKNNFYYTSGGVSKVISTSPNAMQTNGYAVFNFLSNILYYSLTDVTVYNDFLNCVNAIPGVNAASSLDAIAAVAQHPFDNVQCIYNLAGNRPEIFEPSLQQIADAGAKPVPDQWTLAVKFNKSGSENFLIAGTAFVVFDKDNKAWVTNNFRQGTDKSATHCLIFNSDGSAADISPITGGGILGTGFGVAVTPDGETIAFGNYGWGTTDWNPAKGSISVFSHTGEVKSPPNGFTEAITRIQGMVYDQKGNLWMASWGTQAPMADPGSGGVYKAKSNPSAVVCYIGGDSKQALSFNNFGDGPSEYHGTFAVAIDKDGSAIVSNAGTAGIMPSSVYRVRIADDQKSLQYVTSWQSDWVSKNPDQIPNFEEFRQPQIDSKGNVYVGGVTSGRVIRLSPDLKTWTSFSENIHGPWGITFDATDKKFITGFGEKKAVDAENKTIELVGPFGITVVESNDENWANAHVMTLPTGGEPVRLANGQPLYGYNQLDKAGQVIAESYQPLMRVTGTSIDRAGNLWCANNWKPGLYIDAKSPNANPGGDGVVIFLGVAEPCDDPVKE